MAKHLDESVLVIASEPSDRERVGALLLDLTEVVLTRRATLVCHRRSPDAPRPTLPASGSHGRVVVLSDCMDEAVVVATLEAGAHHYLDIDEPPALLRARLAAALRSHARQLRRDVVVDPFRFDPGERRAWRGERALGLSPKEFDLALYLFVHRGRAVGNEELMTAVWSLPRTTDSRRIDTAACRVRKKMALERDCPWRLRRLGGEGYLLVERDVVAEIHGAPAGP